MNEPLTKDKVGLTDAEATSLYEAALHSAKDTKGKIANAVILTAQYIETKKAAAVRLLREKVWALRTETGESTDFKVGHAKAINNVMKLIDKVLGGVEEK